MPFDSSFVNISAESDLFAADSGLPSTWWVSGTIALNRPIPIPATVTLSFAPGARFILRAGAQLVVNGRLDAGLETRFVITAERDAEAVGPVGPPVSLLGPLEEIHADWWAEIVGGPSRVTRALEVLWERYRQPRLPRSVVLPAPIMLSGPYRLNTPLPIVPPPYLLTDPTASSFDVVLLGRHSNSGDPTTFVADAPPQPMTSFLQVGKKVALTLENVGFDATVPDASNPSISQIRVLACVAFDDPADGSRFEACSFRFVNQAIQINGGGLAPPTTATLDDIVRRVTLRPVRLDVLRCVFTGARVTESYNLETKGDPAPASQGIRVDVGTPVSLSVRDCQFGGVFANAVAILGGDLEVMACQFANEATTVIDYLNANSAIFPTADLLVRRWDDDTLYIEAYSNLKDSGLTVHAHLVGKPRGIYSGTPLINTHVTVTHCVSTSPCFLIMGQSFPYSDTVKGGAAVSNLRHKPSGLQPTSIVARSGIPARGLTLVGCELGGSVRVEDGSGGSVVDIGTAFPVSPYILIGFVSEVTSRKLEVVTL